MKLGKLSKNQQSCVEQIVSRKLFSIFIFIVGIFGILTGIYSLFFNSLPPGERSLNMTLIGYSIGFVFMGYFLYQAYVIIGKLTSADLSSEG